MHKAGPRLRVAESETSNGTRRADARLRPHGLPWLETRCTGHIGQVPGAAGASSEAYSADEAVATRAASSAPMNGASAM